MVDMELKRWILPLLLLVAFVWFVSGQLPKGDRRNHRVDISKFQADGKQQPDPQILETATFGGGCFWCVEAVLERIRGVASVESGYSGGKSVDPSYREISSGRSGHAEVVQVRFDPEMITYDELLTVFWELHDPTTLNRQGADRGTQYRSVIFYHSDAQRMAAENSLAAKNSSGDLRAAIVTEIAPAPKFYPAEDYHQDYFENNPDAGYCRAVISPKLQKLGLLN